MVEEVIYDFCMLWSGLIEIGNSRVKAPGEVNRCYSWAILLAYCCQEAKALPCFPFPLLLLSTPAPVLAQTLTCGWPHGERI